MDVSCNLSFITGFLTKGRRLELLLVDVEIKEVYFKNRHPETRVFDTCLLVS